MPYGPYFVDIHAIMDKQMYDETVNVCGEQGQNCKRPNSAPVCGAINSRKLIDVCDSYRLCGAQDSDGASGLQHAYTCDAVLCTSKCAADDTFEDDLEITAQACGELSSCAGSPGIGAILALETQLGCSCCASQVCDCASPNATTDETLYDLNAAQCARGITPQCCRNGTLCGRKNGQAFTCPDGKCPSS